MRSVCLVLPSLTVGGMERVMSLIANALAKSGRARVHLILLSRRPRFFTIHRDVIVYEPQFAGGGAGVIRTLFYLREHLKKIRPYSVLSFGSKYNSFVMMASCGLGLRVFLSDRSTPLRNSRLAVFRRERSERHDGFIHFFLKRLLYRYAEGIIVQTRTARDIESVTLKHKNIIHIPNPIRLFKNGNFLGRRKRYVLNVGRFVKSKQQQLLLEVFAEINSKDWTLVFVGDGPELDSVRHAASELGLTKSVLFLGSIEDVEGIYYESQVFAFVSNSEGFPNALAEALGAGLATVAFDCVAGPSDLIDDGRNGFLVPLGDRRLFSDRLRSLLTDEQLRHRLGAAAAQSVNHLDEIFVIERFSQVLLN